MTLSADGHACELAANATAAQEMLERQPFDVVISDIRMVAMSGLELLDSIKRSHPSLPFIALTGAAGTKEAVDAIQRGAFHYLVKPCDAAEIRKVVAKAVHAARSPVPSPATDREVIHD